MSKDNDVGIYMFSNKTFYYLEAGDNFIGNTLDRVRKTLIQRDIIVANYGNVTEQQYLILTLKEAKRKDYVLHPVFISKHIEKLFKSKQEQKGSFK